MIGDQVNITKKQTRCTFSGLFILLFKVQI